MAHPRSLFWPLSVRLRTERVRSSPRIPIQSRRARTAKTMTIVQRALSFIVKRSFRFHEEERSTTLALCCRIFYTRFIMSRMIPMYRACCLMTVS